MNFASRKRVRWRHTERVPVPAPLRRLLWDEPDGTAPLEKLLFRVLLYGRFEEIRWAYQTYPEQSYDVVQRYAQLPRGVRFWIRRWHDR